MRLVSPPRRPVAVDFDAFEREVGAPMPADYVHLMRTYGPGGFDEFLTVLAPDPTKRANVFKRTRGQREINEALAASDDPDYHFPYLIYPDQGGLLTWGEHTSGHTMWWLTQGDPDDWPVLIQGSQSQDFFCHSGTAAALICGLIEDTLDVWFLPTEEPIAEHRFDPDS